MSHIMPHPENLLHLHLASACSGPTHPQLPAQDQLRQRPVEGGRQAVPSVRHLNHRRCHLLVRQIAGPSSNFSRWSLLLLLMTAGQVDVGELKRVDGADAEDHGEASWCLQLRDQHEGRLVALGLSVQPKASDECMDEMGTGKG